MRLIDADALIVNQMRIARANETEWQDGYWAGVDDTLADIADAPTIETEPKRGRWVPFHSEAAGDIQYCSYCGVGFAHRTDFCPNCGADMREVDNDTHEARTDA